MGIATSAFGQCNILCTPANPCPPACNGSGMAIIVEPLAIFSHGCTIPYRISIQVSPPACNATDVQVRFFPPNDPPNNPVFCQATNGILLATLPVVEQGAPPIIIDASGITVPAGYPCPPPVCNGCSMLNYVVNHADEEPGAGGVFPNNLNRVRAFICASGNSQGTIGGSAAGQAEHPVPVAHPCIKVDKTATLPTPFCRNVSNLVDYSFAVSIPTDPAAQADSSCPMVCNPPDLPCFGDTPLNNILLTDDHCSPVPDLSGGFNVGDANTNNVLDLTETWQFRCDDVNVMVATTNTATVMGTTSFPNGTTFSLCLPGAPVTVTDTDPLTVTPNQPPLCTVTPENSCNPAQVLTATGTTCSPTCLCTCSWTKDGVQVAPAGSPCTFTATGAGEYCATLTDCNGCVSTNECCAEVGEISVQIVCEEIACELIRLCAVATGTPPFVYDWGAGPTAEPCIDVTLPGIYSVTVTDANLCTAMADITITGSGGGGSGPFADAVTGDNQFRAGNGKHYWFVDPGADNYDGDCYERPTVQTYRQKTAANLVAGGPSVPAGCLVSFLFSGDVMQGTTYIAAGESNPTYFEYLDIVSADINVSNPSEILGSIELFGTRKVGDNGVRTADFGESSHYNIRIANNPDGRGGLLLAAENPKDLNGNWKAQESMAYLDVDGCFEGAPAGVGGPGGLATSKEDDINEADNRNGYELKVVNDGKLTGTNLYSGPQTTILWARRVTNACGRPVVEFRFNLTEFNAAYPNCSIDTANLCVVFEATRGLKGGSNYLWNDKYTFAEAGNPYATVGLQNIYELDTLCVCLNGGCLECPPTALSCLADVNRDGAVNIQDLLMVLHRWGPCVGCAEDIAPDGVVNISDLMCCIEEWGECPTP